MVPQECKERGRDRNRRSKDRRNRGKVCEDRKNEGRERQRDLEVHEKRGNTRKPNVRMTL
jgi:hypothetical protein